TFATTNLTNPRGMGRIVRDEKGKVVAIVEEKDATEEQKKISEVNAACYMFNTDFLKKYLPQMEKSAVSGEYYLTKLIQIAHSHNQPVETVAAEGKWKGINTPEDLREAE